jgi:hypothetical protein
LQALVQRRPPKSPGKTQLGRITLFGKNMNHADEISESKQSAPGSFAASFGVWLLFGVPTFFAANVASYIGCLLAGVKEGGWNWQFMGAIIIGSIYGPLSFSTLYIISLCRGSDRISSGFFSALISVVSSFLISLIGYLVSK